MSPKIKSFTDLIAWQQAHDLVVSIYKMTTRLPLDEKYGFVDQIKRASISISSNIAEGFSRKSIPEKTHFYYIALGSLTEVQNLLLVAKDVKYLDRSSFIELANKSVVVSKLINSILKGVK